MKYWKEVTILVLSLACYILYTRPEPQPQVVEKIVERVVTVEKVVKDKNKETVTVKPDGTKIVVIEHEKVIKDKVKKKDKKVNKEVVVVAKSKWSLQVNYTVDKNIDLKPENVELGRRLYQTPMWAIAGYDNAYKAFYLGMRIEW